MNLLHSATRRTLIGLVGAGLTAIAMAQDFPSQPVRIIVPFPAGGSTDLVTRALATELGAALQQSVVVENKAGAGSLIGSEFVIKSPADGYTLLMAGLTNVFLPHVHKNLKFHPMDDLQGVGLVADLPNVLAVNAATPYKKLDDLIKADKQKPGSLSFASAGVATPSHLVCEMINHQSGSKLGHVPYKGNAPAVADLMGGHIPVMCNNLGGTLPGLEAGLWMGLAVPKSTPKEVVQALNNALTKAMATDSLKEKLSKLGATPLPSSLAAFDDRVRQDRKAWDPMLSTLNLQNK